MTNSEFSNSFDTLLNSYSIETQFGEEESKADIVLNEYEKSVFLSAAQDIIVKSFFDGTHNSEGEGFDDSIKRQIDFSSLITTATLTQSNNQEDTFDDRGIIFNMPLRKYPNNDGTYSEKEGSTDVLFILNEKLKTTYQESETSEPIIKNYVIVPINYKEYDREMSKAYSQPLKRQAWRLFQNNSQGFDIKSELIPRWNLTAKETIIAYKIRYIRRPRPIVLVNLTENLEIDGFTKQQECEINPILHSEILQKAFELAISTRGGRIPTQSRTRESQSNNNNNQ